MQFFETVLKAFIISKKKLKKKDQSFLSNYLLVVFRLLRCASDIYTIKGQFQLITRTLYTSSNLKSKIAIRSSLHGPEYGSLFVYIVVESIDNNNLILTRFLQL